MLCVVKVLTDSRRSYLPRFRPEPLAAQLELLTAIRFFAAFWVYAFHFWSWTGLPETPAWFVAGNGARGVDLFFVLSGFVIFHVYGRNVPGRSFDLGTFLWRRIARVYPMHLVMLLVWLTMLMSLAAMGISMGRQVTPWDMVASLLLIQSWNVTDGVPLNGVSWSVSAEMSVYLVFGLLTAFTAWASRWGLWLLILVASAILADQVARAYGYPGFMHPDWEFGGLRIFPSFALGVLTRMAADHIGPRLAGAIGIAALAGLVIALRAPGADYELLPLFAMLILAAARLSPLMRNAPGVRSLVYLGEISYSTYMLHSLFLVVALNLGPRLFTGWHDFPPIPVGLTLFAVILIASVISYHLIELPARRWLNGLWSRRRAGIRMAKEAR